jgi:hypothetical protein
VNVEFPLNSVLSIQPELNYSRRGFGIIKPGAATSNVNYNSLELPLFLVAGVGSTIRPYVFAGPMAIWNISRTTTGGGAAVSTRTFDYAASGGVGLDVSAFFVNARYTVGLNDVTTSSASWYSRGFRLMAGFRL